MSRREEERGHLLYLAGSRPSGRAKQGLIGEADYAAVYSPPADPVHRAYGPCLIWRHTLNAAGYGYVHLNGRNESAHRMAYEMSREESPHDRTILHACRRRSCVQPAHLYLGSAGENPADRGPDAAGTGVNGNRKRAAPNRQNARGNTGEKIREGEKHYWDEPGIREPLLIPVEQTGHPHQYEIPVGMGLRQCSVCFDAEPIRVTEPGFFRATPEDEAEARAAFRKAMDPSLAGRRPGDPPMGPILPGQG